MKSRILITGANGQLGNCLRDLAPSYPEYEFIYTDIAELSVTDKAAVTKLDITDKSAVAELSVTDKAAVAKLDITDKSAVAELSVTDKVAVAKLDITDKAAVAKLDITDKAAVAELDITDKAAVAELFDQHKPQWVINTAAYTAVDKAESEPELAMLLNATAVGILAEQSARLKAGLVQISTDYVFDGDTTTILTEEMPVNPQGVYGKTKLEGEKQAARNPKHIILRTSWLYSAYGNNFVKTMRRLGSSQPEIRVVADQWGSPTLADDLALAIMIAIKKADTGSAVYGLYHFSNEGSTCWADFAQQIMDLSGLGCSVKAITTAEYPTPSKRPAFSVMSKAKFSTTFGEIIPEWEASLEKLIARMK